MRVISIFWTFFCVFFTVFYTLKTPLPCIHITEYNRSGRCRSKELLRMQHEHKRIQNNENRCNWLANVVFARVIFMLILSSPGALALGMLPSIEWTSNLGEQNFTLTKVADEKYFVLELQVWIERNSQEVKVCGNFF